MGGIFGVNLNTTGLGLGAGIDVQSTVASLIAAARAPEQALTDEQTLFQSQTSAITNLNTLLTTLQNAANALQDSSGQLTDRVASSSDTTVLTASAAAGAALGNHTVSVSALATISSVFTTPLTDGNTKFSDGVIQLQIGSSATPVSITVSATNNNETLNSLASYINSNSQSLGVTANVITDANGARLSLVSNTSGQPGNLTVLSNTTGLSFNDPTTGNPNAVAGTNAALMVDGVSLSSTSNTVTGAINGVTLNLLGKSSSSISLSVNPDVNQAAAAVNSFVSAYNAVAQAINSQFTFAAGASAPPLFSDSALQQVQQTLTTDLNHALTGNGGINCLASIGVNVQQDGTLKVNSGTLTSALQSQFGNVQTFFQQQTGQNGFAVQFSQDLNSLTDPTGGPLNIDLKNIQQSLTSVGNDINDFEARLALQQQALTAEFSQVNSTLQTLPLLLAQITGQLSGGSSSGA